MINSNYNEEEDYYLGEEGEEEFQQQYKMNNNSRLNSEIESDGDSVSNTSHLSNNLDVTGNSEEEEEKQKLIERVLELQSTLEDLSKKVSVVKEENLKLKSENEILGNYIDNLMQSTNLFQTTKQINK